MDPDQTVCYVPSDRIHIGRKRTTTVVLSTLRVNSLRLQTSKNLLTRVDQNNMYIINESIIISRFLIGQGKAIFLGQGKVREF